MQPIPDGGDATGPRRVKPHAPYLSPQDLSILDQAYTLADKSQWDAARGLAAGASNPIVNRLVEWRYVGNAGSGADFATITRFLAAHPDWPNARGIQARAEAAMPAGAMDPGQVIAWFAGKQPVAGDGMVKLGDALVRSGERARGEALIRRGWVTADPAGDALTILFERHGGLLTQADHEARLSYLLWMRKYPQAQAMYGRVSPGAAAAATARIRLQSSARDADAAYAAVPSSHRADAGLLFDRARWLRRRDREAEAAGVLIQAGGRLGGPAPDADAWWDERNVLARKALESGRVSEAYALAAGHRILPEDNLVDFAEGEFLAGWIALQFQNRPDTALGHFKRLRQGVTAPISAARAHYWAGRAHAKAGRTAEARAEYQQAGQWPLTYYGLLALQETAQRVRLQVPPGFKPGDRSAFGERPLIAGMRALADLGEQGRVRAFVLAAAEAMTDGQDYANLVAAVRDLGEVSMALRVAKRALQKNIPVFDLAYPTMQTPPFAGSGQPPETALILGLTRQESEFDPAALSNANAHGLMQLIPSTAKMTATRHGIAYGGRADLFNPTTNMRLGAAHMADLISSFGGSYVMAIGAYNAGSGRIGEWTGRFGDPRNPSVDPVDWVERVPFSETRNYIQRVLENTAIYRAILNGREAPVNLAQDLRRGGYAMASVQPQFSSDPAAQPAPAPEPAALPAPQTPPGPRASPIVPDDDETAAPATPKPPAAKPAKGQGRAKAKPPAKPKVRVAGAKPAKAKGAKPAKPVKRTDAAPRCKPGQKGRECRKGRS